MLSQCDLFKGWTSQGPIPKRPSPTHYLLGDVQRVLVQALKTGGEVVVLPAAQRKPFARGGEGTVHNRHRMRHIVSECLVLHAQQVVGEVAKHVADNAAQCR